MIFNTQCCRNGSSKVLRFDTQSLYPRLCCICQYACDILNCFHAHIIYCMWTVLHLCFVLVSTESTTAV